MWNRYVVEPKKFEEMYPVHERNLFKEHFNYFTTKDFNVRKNKWHE